MFWKIKEDKPVVKKVHLADKWTTSAIRNGMNSLISVSMTSGQERGGYTMSQLYSLCSINEDLCKDLMRQLCHMGIYKRVGEYYEPNYVTPEDLVREEKKRLESSI